MNLALRMFVDEHAKEIGERNLFRNFVVHCCNLFEFGVIGPGYVFAAVTRMELKLKELGLKTATTERTKDQWNLWSKRSGSTTTAAVKSPSFSGIFNKTESKTSTAATASTSSSSKANKEG